MGVKVVSKIDTASKYEGNKANVFRQKAETPHISHLWQKVSVKLKNIYTEEIPKGIPSKSFLSLWIVICILHVM